MWQAYGCAKKSFRYIFVRICFDFLGIFLYLICFAFKIRIIVVSVWATLTLHRSRDLLLKIGKKGFRVNLVNVSRLCNWKNLSLKRTALYLLYIYSIVHNNASSQLYVTQLCWENKEKKKKEKMWLVLWDGERQIQFARHMAARTNWMEL
jgi:hypothetical protein